MKEYASLEMDEELRYADADVLAEGSDKEAITPEAAPAAPPPTE